MTEITHVNEPKFTDFAKAFFVGEQPFGPYVMWHHENHFIKISDHETKMIDRVSFKLPFGFVGSLVAGKLVQDKVK